MQAGFFWKDPWRGECHTSFLLAALVIFIRQARYARGFPCCSRCTLFLHPGSRSHLFFLRPHEFVQRAGEYLVLLPIYLIVLFYASVRSMKSSSITSFPGARRDHGYALSATETVALEIIPLQYQEILQENPQPVYYGRVTEQLGMTAGTVGKASSITSFMRSMTGALQQDQPS